MAPRQPIDPILPAPPVAGSLLQSVAAVPGDWRTGVVFAQRDWQQFVWPDCVPDWEACTGETLADKPDGPDCVQIAFDPFTVYTPVTEESVQPDEAQRLTAQARAVHEAMLSRTVARTMSGQGDGFVFGADDEAPFCITEGALSTNPTLASAATAVGPSCDPVNAFGQLLSFYGDGAGTSAGAMIHVDLSTLVHLFKTGMVAQVGQRFVGPGGVIVVADAGYAFASGFVGVMFVSGPVEVSLGPVVTIPGGEAEDARLNQWALLIEQRVIYRFDPLLVGVSTICLPCECTAP